MTGKACRLCGHIKPLGEFPSHKTTFDGRRGECVPCNREKQKAWREANREARRQRAAERYRMRADEIREERRQFRARERERINARRREMRRANPERYREQKRRYLAENPVKREEHAIRTKHRKRLKRELAPVDLEYVLIVRRDPCSYCGAAAGGTWDHIEPAEHGGASTWQNSTGACVRCNASKKDRKMLLWMADPARPRAWEQAAKPMPDMPSPDTEGPEPMAA